MVSGEDRYNFGWSTWPIRSLKAREVGFTWWLLVSIVLWLIAIPASLWLLEVPGYWWLSRILRSSDRKVPCGHLVPVYQELKTQKWEWVWLRNLSLTDCHRLSILNVYPCWFFMYCLRGRKSSLSLFSFLVVLNMLCLHQVTWAGSRYPYQLLSATVLCFSWCVCLGDAINLYWEGLWETVSWDSDRGGVSLRGMRFIRVIPAEALVWSMFVDWLSLSFAQFGFYYKNTVSSTWEAFSLDIGSWKLR